MANLSAQIRDYLAANPWSASAAIAIQIGAERAIVARSCLKMVQRGILYAQGAPGNRNYCNARAPLVDRTASPEEIAARKKQARREIDAKHNERRRLERLAARRVACANCKPIPAQPAPIVAESVEEWLAKGGRPIVLPANWERPNYRQLGAGMLF